MNEFPKDVIIQEMKRTGLVPVFYHSDVTIAKAVVKACYQGGVRVFEFTNRGENALALLKELLIYAEKFSGLIIGAGTIMSGEMAEKFILNGAQFIVSPVLKMEMATVCQAQSKLWIPGCGTLTEIVAAKEAGAGIVKLFPGSILGPKFVSAVLPVVPDLKLMPTGGVEITKENLKAWFAAGVHCVGVGSPLVTKEIVQQRDWSTLELRVREAVGIIAECKAT